MYDDHHRDSTSTPRRDHSPRHPDSHDRGERRGVPLSELDPALTAVSHKVIGAARDIHVTLGQGFDKHVYIDALAHALAQQGVGVKVGTLFTPQYKGQPVGSAAADLFVDGKFLVEVMSTPGQVESWDRLRLRAKLKAADLELGLILNFGGRLMKDGLVRVLNPDKIKSLRTDDSAEHDTNP